MLAIDLGNSSTRIKDVKGYVAGRKMGNQHFIRNFQTAYI